MLQTWQKDAIYRQMLEYKREVKYTKTELETTRKNIEFHDEHLRVVDSWLSQLVEEVALLSNQIPTPESPESFPAFETSLFHDEATKFRAHLDSKSDRIRSAIKQLFSRLPEQELDTSKLQERLSRCLAREKTHALEMQRLQDQNTSLESQLETAIEKYMVAEKKLDRLKSQPVQKLEAQAKQPPKKEEVDGGDSPNVKDEDTTMVNGISAETSARVDSARKQAIAARDKLQENLNKLTQDNKSLTDELTIARAKYCTLSDEDYSQSELYKTLKAQHEDVIKRVNDLQAIHTALRAEIKQLQAERTQFKDRIQSEQETAIQDSESQVTKLGLDIARIRGERDNLLQDVTRERAERQDQSESTARRAELDKAKEERIASLESEVERLQAAAGGASLGGTDEDLDGLERETVQARLQTAMKEKHMLEKELSSMAQAYKKALGASSQKLANTLAAEERVARANAEKTKADQKFFQQMKKNEALAVDLSKTKAQNAKTSEIVSSMKESESNRKAFIVQLEKQIADVKDSLASVEKSHRDLQQREYDFKTKSERATTQIEDLKKQLTAKDDASLATQKSQRTMEKEAAELRVRLEEAENSAESYRKKALGNSNEEFDTLKSIATCTICRKNFKSIALTKCGHVFCQPCVDERYNSRARKCPNCGCQFGQNDRLKITL